MWKMIIHIFLMKKSSVAGVALSCIKVMLINTIVKISLVCARLDEERNASLKIRIYHR